jgi:hypothetical protein
MINAGTYNLITIMNKTYKIQGKEYLVKQTAISLRKATSKRNMELLEAFNRFGLCEAITQVLIEIGEEELDKIEKIPHNRRTRQQ